MAGVFEGVLSIFAVVIVYWGDVCDEKGAASKFC